MADFRLVDLAARPVNFSDLSGRPVVLNFWATWCAPCRREMPLLDRLRLARASDGLEVIGVDVAEPVARVREFVASLGIKCPIWVDPPTGATGFDSTRAVYGRTASVGLPTTLFIDRQGVVSFKYLGELNQALVNGRSTSYLPVESILQRAPPSRVLLIINLAARETLL